MMKIPLEIVGMSYSQSQSGAYALILNERDGKRRLPIIIGGFEAQAIAIELEKMKPSRPLTHDLFMNFAKHFEIEITEVVINLFKEGIFYAKLVCKHQNSITEIDARTSDAVALAIRFNCPIYTHDNILDEAGITLDEPEISGEEHVHEINLESDQEDFGDYSFEELQDMIDEAIKDENYEQASRLRDEIKKRKERES